MKHRGTARKRPVILTAAAPLPASGTPVTADGKPLGTLGTVIGPQALAILRIDRSRRRDCQPAFRFRRRCAGHAGAACLERAHLPGNGG